MSQNRLIDAAGEDMKPLPFLMYNITWSCNIKCDHCIYSCGPSKGDSELDKETVFEFFEELAQRGVNLVAFSGGEPFSVDYFIDLLQKLTDLGMHAKINTNGTLITEDVANQLDDLNVFGVRVSIDGPNAELHDRRRGQGNFERSMEGLEHLQETNIPVSIATTVTSETYEYADQFMELSECVCAEWHHFFPVATKGRAKEQPNLMLSSEQVETFETDFKDHDAAYESTLDDANCDPSFSFIQLTPNGDLYLNTHAGKHGGSENLIGNIKSDAKISEFTIGDDCADCQYYQDLECRLIHNYCWLDGYRPS